MPEFATHLRRQFQTDKYCNLAEVLTTDELQALCERVEEEAFEYMGEQWPDQVVDLTEEIEGVRQDRDMHEATCAEFEAKLNKLEAEARLTPTVRPTLRF